MVLICTMVLALLVGLAVTSETLYAAVLAQSKEFAVLEALGIHRRHVGGLVLAQSFWLGVGGILLARCPAPWPWPGRRCAVQHPGRPLRPGRLCSPSP